MTWNIIDKKLKKIACINDCHNFTVGNKKECDIFIQTKAKNSLLHQIFLENGFIFEENNQIINVSYLDKNIEIESHIIEIKCKFLPLLEEPLENEISNIFSSDIFKTTLEMIQNDFSNHSNTLNHKIKTEISIFIKKSCHYLNKLFWENHDFFEISHRNLFQKYIWCLWAQAYQYGVITSVLHDESISEIMVNSANHIFLEKNGLLTYTQLKFDSNESLMGIIERICDQVGRKIDESTPFCDARLEDGSRIHAIIPLLSLNGPCLTIRKFPKKSITFAELIHKNSIPKQVVDYLHEIVMAKKNILISGGTGTGKITLLNCLYSFIHSEERIITIEDSAELKLQQPHVIRLETRKENVEQKGSIPIRELLRNALRMRPDRIIIGECRGEEALDMLQAMNTGHDGSMTTIHSNSTADALRRLETLVLFAACDLPSRAIREQIASAIHYIIQLSRDKNGHRSVSAIQQMISLSDDNKFYTKSIYEKI